MSLCRAARSCHRRAVSRRHRARKRSLLLGDDFSIAVSPLRTNGRSGFGARRLSAFYGLFRSVFLIFSIRLHFPLLSALQVLAVFVSSGSYHLQNCFFRRFQFPSVFFHQDAEDAIVLVSFFCKIVLWRRTPSSSRTAEKTVAPVYHRAQINNISPFL